MRTGNPALNDTTFENFGVYRRDLAAEQAPAGTMTISGTAHKTMFLLLLALGSARQVTPSDPTVAFTHRLTMGDPAGEIVRIAAEEGAEMIVLGTHGRSGMSRMLMGSVAEAVVRRAPCPVLVYRAAVETLENRRAEALHL
jgi:nucleotide-binding universal stress UspA family protein